MPLSALREIEVDYTASLADIGPLLTNIVMKDFRQQGEEKAEGAEGGPTLTEFTCPDCRGTIWEVLRGTTYEYRCRIGHIFSPRTMLAEHFAAQEKVLWSAVVALEEGASLTNKMADSWPELSNRLRAESRECRQQAEMLRGLLNERTTFSVD